MPSSGSRRDFLKRTGSVFAASTVGFSFHLQTGKVAAVPENAAPKTFDLLDYDKVEHAIQDAINYTHENDGGRVLLSEDLLPYDASTVTFDPSVQMMREENQSDVYDVAAYGASRDNTSTGWNHLSVEEAIRGASQGSQIVQIKGQVRCSSSIVWPEGTQTDMLLPVTLIGDGDFRGTGTGDLFFVEGAGLDLRKGDGSQTFFLGGIVNVTLRGDDSIGSIGIDAHKVTEATFREISIRGFDTNIYVRGASYYSEWHRVWTQFALTDGLRFEGPINGSGPTLCRFSNNGGQGLSISNAAVDVTVERCWMEQNNNHGALIKNTIQVNFERCYFEGNDSGAIRMRNHRSGDAQVLYLNGNYYRPSSKRIVIIPDSPQNIKIVSTACLINNNTNEANEYIWGPADAGWSVVAISNQLLEDTTCDLLNTTPDNLKGLFIIDDELGAIDSKTSRFFLNQLQSEIGQLTDHTGGSTDETIEEVSGSGADGAINNNFAEMNAKLDAIIDVLVAGRY